MTLFATGDSQTKAKHHWVAPRAYSEDQSLDPKVWECLHIANVFEQAQDFDLIHNHFDFLPLTYTKLIKTPVVTTIHGFSSPQIVPVYQKYNQRVHYISISNADRHPSLDYCGTVYHGVPVEEYPFGEQSKDYLLYLGRIHRDKGTREAVRFAQRMQIPLIIAGIIQDQKYFDHYIAPYVDANQIKFIGPVGGNVKGKLLAEAKALLHLINFDEPFGLTVVEAMACGTPVLAINRGSMSELIVDGMTGLLVDTLMEAEERYSEIEQISRRYCRQWVQTHFAVEIMVQRYLEVYQKILDNGV